MRSHFVLHLTPYTKHYRARRRILSLMKSTRRYRLAHQLLIRKCPTNRGPTNTGPGPPRSHLRPCRKCLARLLYRQRPCITSWTPTPALKQPGGFPTAPRHGEQEKPQTTSICKLPMLPPRPTMTWRSCSHIFYVATMRVNRTGIPSPCRQQVGEATCRPCHHEDPGLSAPSSSTTFIFLGSQHKRQPQTSAPPSMPRLLPPPSWKMMHYGVACVHVSMCRA